MEEQAISRPSMQRLLRTLSHPAATGCYFVLMLLPLLWAGRYNHPSNDDYSNSVWTDFWAYQRFAYMELTGRVTSSFFLSLNPIRWGWLSGYRVAADILIVSFALVYTLTISRLLAYITRMPLRFRLLLGLASTFVIFNCTISLAEGFYWYSGAMTYTLPVILLCCAALAGTRMHERRKVSPAAAILQVTCVALATTCNEVVIPALGLLLAGLICFYHQQRNPGLRRWYAALTLVWALAAAVEMLSPGNYLRQAGQDRNMLIAIPTWLFVSKDLFLEWIAEPVFLTFSIATVATLSRYPTRNVLRTLPALLLCLGLIAVILFPGFWGLGRIPPRRVRNLCFMCFVPCWGMLLSAVAAWVRELVHRLPEAWRLLRVPLRIGICLLLLSQFRIENIRGSSNYAMLAKNFRKGTLVRYDAEQRVRYNLIRNNNSDTVLVPRLRSLENNIVFFGDLSPNLNGYPNTGLAAYWKKRYLGLLPDSSSTIPH